MKCLKCGYTLPEDSKFCRYCGEKINFDIIPTEYSDSSIKSYGPTDEINNVFPDVSENTAGKDVGNAPVNTDVMLQQPESAAVRRIESVPPIQYTSSWGSTVSGEKRRVCKRCGGAIDFERKRCVFCGKKYFQFPKKVMGIVALALVFVVLAGFNIAQYMAHQKDVKIRDAAIADLEQQIESKDSEISSLNSQLTTWKQKALDYEPKAETYDTICDFMTGGNAGYASNNFKASDSIIVISQSDTNKSFTLTANFYTSVMIDLNTSGWAADVTFSESSWYGSTTTIYVTPNFVGTTIATFSNNLNSQTFRVLIIVTG